MRRLILVLVALVLTSSLLLAGCSKPAPAPSPAPKVSPATSAAPKASPASTPVSKIPDKLHWDIALGGSPRTLTYPIEDWSKDMKEATNGRWEIHLNYGDVLSPPANRLDGVKGKVFQGCMVDSMYSPGKTPLLTVMDNPFVGPGDVGQMGEWFMVVAQHPAVTKELDAWNVKTLFSCPIPSYNFMGKKPIKKVEDFKGLRVRVDPVSGKPLEAYGAVVNTVTAGEIYTALERGMIDSVCWAWSYTFGSYRIYELSKYATIDIDLKVTPMYIGVNKDDWNALPEEWKKLSNESTAKSNARYVKYSATDDDKWIPIFTKAGIEITKFPPEEKAKLVAKAESAWESWVKEMEGKGLTTGREVLNFAIAKRNELAAKAKK